MALVWKTNRLALPQEVGAVAPAPRALPPGRVTMYWASLNDEQRQQALALKKGLSVSDIAAMEARDGAVIQLTLDWKVVGFKKVKAK